MMRREILTRFLITIDNTPQFTLCSWQTHIFIVSDFRYVTKFSIICQVFIILVEKGKYNPGNIHLFKVDNKNTRKRCKIC